jgi:hypothetical protein
MEVNMNPKETVDTKIGGEIVTKAIESLKKQVEKKKKCFIVGFAPSWKETPWEDQDAEVWCLNEFYKMAEQNPDIKDKIRVDRWFEIHNLERPPKNSKEHLDFLESLNIPLYTLKKWDFLKNANQIVFPFDEVCKWFKDRGHIGYRYFTNSISWFIALAITEGFEEIHVYGVDMAVDVDKNGNGEYGYQKPSCEYFLGVAEKYAKVFIPESSDLLMCAQRYAVDMDNERYVYVKKQLGVWEEMTKKEQMQLQQMQAQIKQLEANIINREGAKSAYRTLLKKRM